MNREIKFRGYCEKDSEWREGYYVSDGNIHVISTLLVSGQLYDSAVDLDSVGQYTGLKDKNGTEIYEGDVVNVWTAGFDDEKDTCQVVYNPDGFYPAFELSPYPDVDMNGFAYFLHEGYIEVIGNIHQHPELIEE